MAQHENRQVDKPNVETQAFQVISEELKLAQEALDRQSKAIRDVLNERIENGPHHESRDKFIAQIMNPLVETYQALSDSVRNIEHATAQALEQSDSTLREAKEIKAEARQSESRQMKFNIYLTSASVVFGIIGGWLLGYFIPH